MAEKNPDVAQVGKLRWLHLSDIHFSRSSDWCDEAARKKLIKMLKTEFDAGRLPKPDCIFCTGDIAQGAATQQEMNAQYASAQTFFDDVLKACGLNKDRLFVVPGNHDVRRTAVSQNYQNGLLASTLPAIKSDWAAANGEFKAAIARLAEYGQFTQSYLPHQAAADPDGRHCYARVVNINSIRIGIAGFNSAWSCHGVTDQNRLWMAAEWQFNAADDVFDDATDLRIGLMHHPASWLNTAEETLMKQRVRDGFQFWLHGHEHQAWVTPTDREIVICAGAVNAKSDPEFGINLVDLDLVKGTGQVHLFAYQTGGNAWLIKPDGDAPRGVRDIVFKEIPPAILQKALNTASATADHSVTNQKNKDDYVELRRRIDAAAPRYADLKSTIDVIVQVRMLDSIPLGKEDFPGRSKPHDVVQDSSQVDIRHQIEKNSGITLPAKLKVRLIAPLFNISGASEVSLEIPASKDSDKLFFMLVPIHLGECRINIELLTLDGEHIKTIPLSTDVGEGSRGNQYGTTSLIVDVLARISGDIQPSPTVTDPYSLTRTMPRSRYQSAQGSASIAVSSSRKKNRGGGGFSGLNNLLCEFSDELSWGLHDSGTVFISYAWEDEAFRGRVRALRDWLQNQGIAVISDFDHMIRPPEKGFATWMQHSIEDATVVLIVCSPKYKSRFEKRVSPDAGKGVAWEGAIITQDLYDAAQRNNKFYPIFPDPINFNDIPKALVPWNNGHCFPSRQQDILALITECLAPASAEQGLLAKAATLSDDGPIALHVIQPNDTERIAQTRQVILDCLHRDYFDGIPRLEFAPDGLPQLLVDAFADCAADANQSPRVQAADNSIYAILKFAREFVECFAELPAAVVKSKEQYWKRLVNAMQHAILLSAKKNRRIDDAYRADAPVALEGMSWLTASVLLRASLADSLRTNPDDSGAMADPLEDGHAASWGDVEIGTGDAAKLQIYNIVKCLMDREPFKDPPTLRQIGDLKGQARLRQKDGAHLLIMNDKTACLPPQLIKWLNSEMFVGHITILEGNGEFDLEEGIWRACLEELLDVMRAFEPKHIRPRIMK